MTRLPTPGSDAGAWGQILNDYLSAAHKQDGTLKDNVISTNNIASGSITEDNLSPDVITKLNTDDTRAGYPATNSDVTASGAAQVNTKQVFMSETRYTRNLPVAGPETAQDTILFQTGPVGVGAIGCAAGVTLKAPDGSSIAAGEVWYIEPDTVAVVESLLGKQTCGFSHRQASLFTHPPVRLFTHLSPWSLVGSRAKVGSPGM